MRGRKKCTGEGYAREMREVMNSVDEEHEKG